MALQQMHQILLANDEILCNQFYTKLKISCKQKQEIFWQKKKKKCVKFSGAPSAHIFLAKCAARFNFMLGTWCRKISYNQNEKFYQNYM